MARLLSALAIMLAVAFSPAARATAQDGIAWVTDLRAAQQTASRDGKLILLHFYADNCPPCRKLEQNVFPLPSVAAALGRNYVPVKVHVDHQPELARQYHIEGWPTDLIVTAAGLEVFRAISPQSAAQYENMLDQVAFQVGIGAARPHNAHAPADPPGGAPNVALTADWQSPAGAQTNPVAAELSNPYVLHRPQRSSATAPANVPQRPATTPPAPSTQASSQPAASPNANPPAQDSIYAPQSSIYAPQVGQPPAQPRPSTQPPAIQRPAEQQPIGSQPMVQQPWPPMRVANQPAATESSIYGGSIYDSDPAGQPPQVTVSQQRPTPQPSVARAGTIPPHGYGPGAKTAPPAQTNQRASAQFAGPKLVEASQAPRVALDGFCPVTILESTKWQKGNVRFGAIHRNRTYLFVTPEAQRKFMSDPDRYAPMLYGCDPVLFVETNQLIDGNHNIGLLTSGGKMFFFTSEEALQRFKRAPQAYTARATQAMSQGIVPAR